MQLIYLFFSFFYDKQCIFAVIASKGERVLSPLGHDFFTNYTNCTNIFYFQWTLMIFGQKLSYNGEWMNGEWRMFFGNWSKITKNIQIDTKIICFICSICEYIICRNRYMSSYDPKISKNICFICSICEYIICRNRYMS